MGLGKVLRALVLVLCVTDNSQDALGLEGLFVQVLLLHDVLDDPFGVIGIINGEVLVEADAVNVPPQDTDAGRVEGGGPDVVGHGPQTSRQTVLQLSRRLVGKGDGDDLPGAGHIHGAEAAGPAHLQVIRPVREGFQKSKVLLRGPLRHKVRIAAPAVGQQVVHPLDQDGGLAAARARQQQKRPLRGHGGLALHGIEPLQVPGDDGAPGGDVAFTKINHMFTSFLGRHRIMQQERFASKFCVRQRRNFAGILGVFQKIATHGWRKISAKRRRCICAVLP